MAWLRGWMGRHRDPARAGMTRVSFSLGRLRSAMVELCGCGFFVLFLLYALGPLSESGGPGGSVPATLCSGASCSGFS